MPSKVYFADTDASKKRGLPEKLRLLLGRLDLETVLAAGDICAVKTHFGESGNSAFVQPLYLRIVVEEIKRLGASAFLTDGNTLYKGSRGNAVDHLNTAIGHGFSYATIGAPLIIADGLNGTDYETVKIDGRHFMEVKIGSAAIHADAMVVVSHFKGHEMTGFGGAIKNVGMGLGSRGAKQQMHSDAIPEIIVDKCTACEKCVGNCPTDAITMAPKTAVINRSLCYSCGECTVICPHAAIEINWSTDAGVMQEKIVEHFLGAVKSKIGKTAYVSFLTNITPDCDCWSFSDRYVCPDIGILASSDPVAIDAAALELVDKATAGRFSSVRSISPRRQLEYAAEIGLGSTDFKLVDLRL